MTTLCLKYITLCEARSLHMHYYIHYLQHTALKSHVGTFFWREKTEECREKPSWQGKEKHIKQIQLTCGSTGNKPTAPGMNYAAVRDSAVAAHFTNATHMTHTTHARETAL